MKISTRLFVLVVTTSSVATASVVLRRQTADYFGLASAFGPGKEPVSIKPLTAKYDSSAKRESLLWGPFKLNSANGTHTPGGGLLKLDTNSDVISTKVGGLCTKCMVLWAQADLATKDGAKVDIGSLVYSHHILMTSIGHAQLRPIVQPPSCGPGKKPGSGFESLFGQSMNGMRGGGMPGMSSHAHANRKRQLPNGPDLSSVSQLMSKYSVFIGQGDEGSAMTFVDPGKSFKSGFYLGDSRDEAMVLLAEAINYSKEPSEVYVKMEYEYIPDMTSALEEFYDVGMGAINVSPCADISLFPPNDKPMKYESPDWNVLHDGYLLDIKPHLHDGGLNVTLFVNGKAACTSKAIYGGETGTMDIDGQKWETITAYESCLEPVGVKKGDKVKMVAWYDLTQHKLRVKSGDQKESAEGMALALFINAQKRIVR